MSKEQEINIDLMLQLPEAIQKVTWNNLKDEEKTKLIEDFWCRVKSEWKTKTGEAFANHLCKDNNANTAFELPQNLATPIPEFKFFPMAKPFWNLIQDPSTPSQKRDNFPGLPSFSNKKWVPDTNTNPKLPGYITNSNKLKYEDNKLKYEDNKNRYWGEGSNIVPEDMAIWLSEMQRILSKGQTKRSRLKKFPRIFLSYEPPPAFRSGIGKSLYDEDRINDISFTDIKPDIETLLGCYIWDSNEIIIWMKGIESCSKCLKFDEKSLFNCVLIHELGHWFNATATVRIIETDVEWNTDEITIDTTTRHAAEVLNNPSYEESDIRPPELNGNARSLSSRCYHEAWAQLFAFLYGRDKNPEVLKVFQTLEPRQSPPYQAWRELINYNIILNDCTEKYSRECILKSLGYSRCLTLPATFDDAQHVGTNMLEWIKNNNNKY